MPQEEKLEVGKQKRTFIGLPKKPVIKNAVFVTPMQSTL
jgi:hypothetical protein